MENTKGAEYPRKKEAIMRKLILSLALGATLALATMGAALADDPHAGNSGNFGNGSNGPCHDGAVGNPHCPPQGG